MRERWNWRKLSAHDWGWFAAMAALILDQGSKLLLLHGFGFKDMRTGEVVSVLPFFNLTMTWNRGISYGLFPARGIAGTLVLSLFSAVIVAILGWWMWHAQRKNLAVGLGLVIGGALGNLIDRLIYGAVADFFQFFAFGYSWYVFNVADVAITLGVIVLLYDALMKPETRAEHSS